METSKRRKAAEATEGHPPSLSPTTLMAVVLPLDVLRVVIRSLTHREHFRLMLTSSTWRAVSLQCIELITIDSVEMRASLRWTTYLSPALQLSQLKHLGLRTIDNGVERVVRFAPQLRELNFMRSPLEQTLSLPNELCNAIRDHTALESLWLGIVDILDHPLGTILPGQLRKLSLGVRPATPPDLIAQIASLCPNLTHLNAGFEPTLAELQPLKRLTRLVKVRIYQVPDLDDLDLWPQLRAVADILPPFDGGASGQWRFFRLGNFNPNYLFYRFRTDLDYLRAILKLRIRPDVELPLSGGRDPFSTDPIEQLDYFRVLFEEAELLPPPCPCRPSLICSRCGWPSIISSYGTLTTSYLVERQFLPFLAAKSALTGVDQGTLASALLRNFSTDPVLVPAALATAFSKQYISNHHLPLNLGFSTHDHRPMIFNLDAQARDLLIARAKATNADLGLAVALSDHQVAGLAQDLLIAAAAVEPRFFLRSLPRFSAGPATLEIAASCTLDRDTKLLHLEDVAVEMLWMERPALGFLLDALELLLSKADVAEIVNQAVRRFYVGEIELFRERGYIAEAETETPS